MKRKCSYCGRIISEKRLEILPDTITCVKCSREKPVIGILNFSGKNFDGVSVIPSKDKNLVFYAKSQLWQKCTAQIFSNHGDDETRKERFKELI